MRSFVLLSVVVVNWNSRDDLARCLTSLARQSESALEVIVVDNASEDGSSALVARDFPQFSLLAQRENLGFAEACNRGIAASRGEWVALLNNDAIAEPDWANALLRAIARAPAACGMLQCTMYFLDRAPIVNSLGLRLTRSGGAIDRFEGKEAVPVADEEIFCPTGGAAVYRRSMLRKLELESGYFDRNYFCYCEDSDLGWRAQLAGWSARLVADAIVHHRRHGSTRRRGRSWFVSMTRTNRLRTLVKNASLKFMLSTAPFTLWELAELLRHGGLRALFGLPSAIRQSMIERRAVSALLKTPRRAVERRWVGVR